MQQETLKFRKAMVIVQAHPEIHPKVLTEVVQSNLPKSHIHYQIACSATQGEAIHLAQQSIDEGVDIVIAAGDRIHVSEVAIGMYLSTVPFMMFLHENTSSENKILALTELTRSLPNSLSAATGDIVWLDLGRVDESFFIYEIVIAKGQNPGSGNIAFSGKTGIEEDDTLIVGIPHRSDFTADISVDDQTLTASGVSISIINFNHGECVPKMIHEGIRAYDGMLDVIIQHGVHADQQEDCIHLSGKKITVKTNDPVEARIDGVRSTTNLLTVEVIPKAVAMFVPVCTSMPD